MCVIKGCITNEYDIEIYVFFLARYDICVYVPARSIKEVGVDVVIAGMGAQA